MYEKSPMPIFDIRSMVCANKSPTEFSNRKTQQVMVIEKNADTRFGLIADGLGEIPEIFESRLNTLPTVLGGSTLLADTAVARDNADEQSLLLVLSCERLAQKLASGMKDEQSPSNTIRKAAELITTPR